MAKKCGHPRLVQTDQAPWILTCKECWTEWRRSGNVYIKQKKA